MVAVAAMVVRGERREDRRKGVQDPMEKDGEGINEGNERKTKEKEKGEGREGAGVVKT